MRYPCLPPEVHPVIVAETRPFDWLLPALLVLTWLALWAARKGTPTWFVIAGVALPVLCFPTGMVAARLELAGTECTPANLCFSADEVDWWWNAILGFVTTGLLALTTMVIQAV